MTRGSDTTGERAAARSARGIAAEAAAELSGAQAPPARAILVLGTPRSGTSILTRLFNLLGADVPGVPTAGGSEAEFNGSDDLRNLNDEILRSAGSTWQDWRAFDRDWYASSLAASFKRRLLDLLHANFSGSSLFVLSDPRICRIAPFWLEALSEFDVQTSAVIALRDPIEVAESLQQRDGIEPPESHLLWLRNMLDAERATRGVPRAVTTRSELLDDWSCLAETLAARLDLSWPRSVESARDAAERFLTKRMRHHEARQEQAAEQVVLIDWVKSTYAAMTRMAHAGTDQSSLKRLNRIASEFDVACLAFGPVTGVIAKPTGNQQRNAVEQDPTRSEPALSQADRISQGEHVELLTREIAKLREDLERKNSDLEMSSTELGVLRALSAIREPSAAIEHRPNRLKAAAQLLLWRGLGVLGRMGYRIERSAQADAIRSSGLFDASWYLERYPDVTRSELDPLFHYLEFGAWEGRDPHPLFDQVWYRATYPEVQRQKQTPLGHFVTVGAATGHNPNPLFHTAWYAASHRDIGTVNPLRHYIEHAAEEGRNPNPLFDSAWYLKENPDVATIGVNPLAHYIHHGIAEARDPHPAFDTDWYVKQYEHVAISGMDALEHYLSFGVVRGYRTRPSNRAGDGPRRAKTRGQRGAFRSPNDGVIERAALAHPIESESSHAAASIDIYRSRMVLRTTSPVAAPFTGEIGVFVHLFYDDLAPEIAAGLRNIPFDSKVYISTNSKEKKETINAAFRQFGFTPVIKVLPNRGWDIAPFLLGFAEEMGDHEICLKLHGKRSRHGYENGERGNAWRKHLLSRLLAHPRNVGFIVDSFSAHPELGVVMPRHWRGVARQVKVIGPNYLHMRRLLKEISVSISPDQPIEFPSGSMFWFRKAALQPLFDLGLSWSDFARCRPRDRDATVAHGIERCILMFAAHAGFRWAFMPRGWVRRSLPSQGEWGRLHRRSDRMGDFG